MSKLGLLVLRNKGLRYCDKVLKRINIIDSLDINGVFYIQWKEKESLDKFRRLYPHIKDEIIIENLLDAAGTLMLAIAIVDSKPNPYKHTCTKCGKRTGAERLDNMNINRIKDDIRAQYGNVIHSADTEEMAIRELKLFGVEELTINKMLVNDFNSKLIEKIFSDSDLVTTLNSGE